MLQSTVATFKNAEINNEEEHEVVIALTGLKNPERFSEERQTKIDFYIIFSLIISLIVSLEYNLINLILFDIKFITIWASC